MDLGEIIRNITGLGNPAAAALQGQPAPADGVRTPAPTAGMPAMAAPPAPQGQPGTAAPGTGTSPPDMTALYQKMLDQERSDKYIDKGAALIAAGFAQPQNRAALLNSVSSGGSGGTSANTALTTILQLQKDQQAKAVRAAQMARLPAIAKKYGLDMDTVNYLFETGKLDETVNTMAQPDMVVESRPDGSKYLLNKKTGTQGRELSGPDKYYGFTNDLKELDRVNEERAAKGQPAIPAETWLTESAKNKANKTNIDLGNRLSVKAGENRLAAFNDEAKRIDTSVETITAMNNARDTLDKGIIAGSVASPAYAEGRKLFANIFGLDDEAANNTDAFLAQMKSVVLPRVKALGTGNSISNADVKFVEQATAATNTMTPEALREIMRIIEKGERNNAAKYHKSIDEFAKIDEDTAKSAKYLRRIKLPAVRAKPESIERLRTEYAKGGDAAKKIKSQFDDYFGDGAADSILEQQ